MQKTIINFLVLLLVLFIVVTAASTASAAPAGSSPTEPSTASGPFEGMFYGWVQSDQGSRAMMLLDLTHQGDIVEGKIYMGEGLVVDGGFCGVSNVPSGVQSASGKTDPRTPDEFNFTTGLEVQGLDIGVEITSQLAADGETLNAEAHIDLPWFCGSDPVISGSLARVQGG